MKNTAWKLILTFVGAFLVISCADTFESTPTFSSSESTFSFTLSSNEIAASASDSLNSVVSLTWTDPAFAVGLDRSKFTIVVGANGMEFVSFQSKSFSKVLTGSLLGKELNAMAIKFGGLIGQPITLDVKVVASQENNNEPLNSEVKQITVTPYGDLSLTSDVTEVMCTPETATDAGVTFSWNTAFNGFSGVKAYTLQYSTGGTNFASITSIDISNHSKTFTIRELNQMAQVAGVAPNVSGDVDFRVMATNELSTIVYSNTVTLAITPYVAFNSIGIIGDFTGWGDDVDLRRLDPTNAPGEWTVTLYLAGGGGVKFRADDAWNDNWGNSAFPSGTGVGGGANIPIANSGYYKVDFNVVTLSYNFTALSPTAYTNISLIGAFNGWGADVDLTADASGHIWTGTLALAAESALKLRVNHDWTIAYGGATIPSGFASTSGGDMTVPAGNYFVYFNDVSGEVIFGNTDNNAGAGSPYTNISLIGDFNGWSEDLDLIKNPYNPYEWSGKATLGTTGGVKLRANHLWDISWGGSGFPTGAGTTQGDPNINVPAGTYQVTFNSATGQYTFNQ